MLTTHNPPTALKFRKWEETFTYYRQEYDSSSTKKDDHPHIPDNGESPTKSIFYNRKDYKWDKTEDDTDNNEKNYSHNEETEETSIWSTINQSPSPPITPQLNPVVVQRDLNVENLVIDENELLTLDPTHHLHLPSMRTLTWHGHPSPFVKYEALDPSTEAKKRQTLRRILMSAPNLKLIKDFHFDTDFDIVIAAGKIHTIEQLCLFDTVNVENLLEFVEARPRLKVLQLIDTGYGPLEPEVRDRLSVAIKLLFLATYETLRFIDLSQFCTYVDVQIPHKLSKLHQLTLGSISNINRTPSLLLPYHIHLEKTFPHLRVLDCSRLITDEPSYWDLYFPPDQFLHGKFGSVKVLVLSDQCTHHFMEKLHDLCPHFVKLVLESRGVDNSLEFMLVKIFRHWSHLEWIEIRLRNFLGQSLCLDSTLTGLSETICAKLRICGPEAGFDYDETITAMQKSQFSIINMTKLKKLDIILGHECLRKLSSLCPEEDQEELTPLMSFVTKKFGMERVKKMKMTVIFDQLCPWGRELLKRAYFVIGPNITLKDKHDRCCES